MCVLKYHFSILEVIEWINISTVCCALSDNCGFVFLPSLRKIRSGPVVDSPAYSVY